MDLLPDDYGRTPHRPYYEKQRNDWSTRPKSQSRSAIIAKSICDHRNADLRSSFSFSLFRKRSLILILMAFAYPYPHPHDSPFCVILCVCCVSLAHCEPKLTGAARNLPFSDKNASKPSFFRHQKSDARGAANLIALKMICASESCYLIIIVSTKSYMSPYYAIFFYGAPTP